MCRSDACGKSIGLEIETVFGADVCGPLALAIEEPQRLSWYRAEISGVSLPSGVSIKDASGLAANLSGTVKTLSTLLVATSSTTPSNPSTP
jgi:hypothetical protein